MSILGLALEALPEDSVDMAEVSNLLIGMKIIGTPSPKRVRAETLNRIIHQFILRQARIRRSSSMSSSQQQQPSSFSDIQRRNNEIDKKIDDEKRSKIDERVCGHLGQSEASSQHDNQSNHPEEPVIIYTGPLLDFEVILNCASTGEPHSRMLLLRGERNMEEFLEESVEPEQLADWC